MSSNLPNVTGSKQELFRERVFETKSRITWHAVTRLNCLSNEDWE